MGHRAHYLLVTPSGYELFSSHGGASRISSDIFWGPEHAERFIRRQKASDYWMNDVWCEGGVCMDFAQRELLFFSEEDSRYNPYVRSVLLALMAPLWPGWTLHWAQRDVVDLAAKVGMPAQAVMASSVPKRLAPIELADKGRPWCRSVATLRDQGRHLTLSSAGWQTLLAGPSVATVLKGMKGTPRIDRDAPGCGFEIAESDRRLRYWVLHGPTLLDEAVKSAWPGWQVDRDQSMVFAHLASLPFFDPPPEEEVLRAVVDSLSREIACPIDDVIALVRDREALGRHVQANPNALIDAPGDLDDDSKSLLLAAALEAYQIRGEGFSYG